jgi:hypothetical protein
MVLMMAYSCSLLPTNPIQITAKPIERTIVQPIMTIPDYEVMAYNMQEIKRYITELKDVVVYYRQVTVTNNE